MGTICTQTGYRETSIGPVEAFVSGESIALVLRPKGREDLAADAEWMLTAIVAGIEAHERPIRRPPPPVMPKLRKLRRTR